MLNAMLFCGELRGHEPGYLRHSGRALASLPGVQLTVVLPVGARNYRDRPEFAFIDDLGVELDFRTPALPGKGTRNAVGRLRSLEGAIERHRPDYVFITTGDLLAQAATSWRLRPGMTSGAPTAIEAIVHACRFAYEGGGLRRKVKNRVSLELLGRSPVESIKLLSFDALERIRCAAPALASRFELVPHPVSDHIALAKVDARAKLGLETSGRIVGCVGAIDERKGIDLLLRAFGAARLREDDCLLLVGRVSDKIRQLIEHDFGALVKERRLLVRDDFVAEAEMAAAISAMDLVCTPYRAQYGLASVILNAAALGRPVLSSTGGWPSAAVARFGLGDSCDVYDVRAFASSIEKCLEAAASFQPSDAARMLTRYHAPANYAAHVTRKVRELLSLPVQDGILSWSTVSDLYRPVGA